MINTQIAKTRPNSCIAPWVFVDVKKNKKTHDYPDRGGDETEEEVHGVTSDEHLATSSLPRSFQAALASTFNIAKILSATSRATAFRSSSGTSSIKKTSVYFMYSGRASI